MAQRYTITVTVALQDYYERTCEELSPGHQARLDEAFEAWMSLFGPERPRLTLTNDQLLPTERSTYMELVIENVLGVEFHVDFKLTQVWIHLITIS